MRITSCFGAGLRRVLQTPSLIFWLYLSLTLFALPLTVAMRNVLRDAIGGSLVQQNLRQGFDMDWYGEFSARHRGMADTFGPGIVGIVPVMSNLEKLVDGTFFETDGTIVAAGALFLVAWAFFGGGIIYRYSKPEESFTRSTLFAESARHFFRFLRLLMISIAIYWGVARWMAGKLFLWVDEITRDATAEKTVMSYTVLIYALVLLVLAVAAMALDYAKIALVTENRRSALLALLRGFRFIWSNPAGCLGLYFALLITGGLWLGAYGLIAPGPSQDRTLTVLLAFGVSQVFLLGRLILKLWFLSGQTLLFQISVKRPM